VMFRHLWPVATRRMAAAWTDWLWAHCPPGLGVARVVARGSPATLAVALPPPGLLLVPPASPRRDAAFLRNNN
jgi:hypothetical protein